MTHYETVFVLPGDAQPQKVDEFVEEVKTLITQKGGEVTLVDKWGRRRLAYPIGRQREGFYTFIQFNADPAFVAELNRFFRVSEEVIREIICKALKGKPASPLMAVPPAPTHENTGRPGASVVPPPEAVPTGAVPTDEPLETFHVNPAPRPA